VGGFPDTAVFDERLSGYRDAMSKTRAGFQEELVVSSAPSRAGGVDAFVRASAMPEPPTAAVCFNDAVAFGVCDGLRARRLEPGKDFAVVGFDDVIEAKTTVPALTTISVDPQGIGQRAAQMLLKQINAGKPEAESIVSSVRLIVRESCGAADNKPGRKLA
jgi:LacI family transcriptional regulator